jgi:hypothetical protein
VGEKRGWIGRIHRRTDVALGYGLRPREAAVVRGMVLGDRSLMPEDLEMDFQRSGVTHIRSMSGKRSSANFALTAFSEKFASAPLWWHHALRRNAQSRLRACGRKERRAMHKRRREKAPEKRAPEQPPFASQVAFARLATALALTGLGAVAIGALVIRALVVKRGRIQRLDIEELEVGRLHVRELVVDEEQSPRQGA